MGNCNEASIIYKFHKLQDKCYFIKRQLFSTVHINSMYSCKVDIHKATMTETSCANVYCLTFWSLIILKNSNKWQKSQRHWFVSLCGAVSLFLACNSNTLSNNHSAGFDREAKKAQPIPQYWIGLCSVLRPRQHSIGYMGDGFYRSKDPTNSIKVLKEKAVKENNPQNTKKTQITHMNTHTKKYTNNRYTNKNSKSPSLQLYGVTRGRFQQRAGSPGLNGSGAAAVVPPPIPQCATIIYTTLVVCLFYLLARLS